jgi:hypothetical protein
MVIIIHNIELPNVPGCRHIEVTYSVVGGEQNVFLSAHMNDFEEYLNGTHPNKIKHELKEKAKELGLNTRQAIKNGLTGIQIEIPD